MFNVYSYDKLKKDHERMDPIEQNTTKGFINRRDKLARNHQERVKKFMIDVRINPLILINLLY
jgi:hypothetical protein